MDKSLQQISGDKTWDDLDVSKATLKQLQLVATGFRTGNGATALFTGPSGTGKTLAAKTLATALGKNLHRVDLAAVVSKYIGETEKNLSAVFEYGRQSDAILLFDEADALFGKRTGIRDSHDRYANQETDILLRSIEAYPGLVIITSNFRTRLDAAFIQRMAWDIVFARPETERRLPLWRRILIRLGIR